MFNNEPVHSNQDAADCPPADEPVEIRGYETDPLKRGYQILSNYESIYWRALVGTAAWSLYEILRTFCHNGNDTCYPSINLLMDILGVSDRRTITGRASTVKADGKEYVYPGLIEELQQHNLVVAEVSGEGSTLRYIFHVNLTPGPLTDEQLARLPASLQKKHRDLLDRCAQAQRELEAKKRPPKQPNFSGNSSEGVENFQKGVENFQGGGGKFPPEQYPYNNTQKTTVVVEKLEEYDLGERKRQELLAKFPVEYIAEKIELLEWKLERQENGNIRRGRPITDPAGWLVRAVENDYQPPPAFFKDRQRTEETVPPAAEPEEQPEEPEARPAGGDRRLVRLREANGTSQREIELWAQALAELKLQMPKATFDNWFAATHLLAIDQGRAVIAVTNSMAKEWLEQRWSDKIKRTLEGLTRNSVTKLEFVVLGSGNQDTRVEEA